jgi:peptidyl-prolyl cis-trans isomerase D
MSTRLRKKRANSVVWGLLALMMLGLGGYGVTSFSGGQTELGHVGDRPISMNDYARTLKREVDAFSAQIGQPVGFAQAQSLGIDRTVLSQLVASATLEGQAKLVGVSVGDAEVFEKIVSAPALQDVSGKFNRDAYSQFLQSQGLSEAEFEQTLRDEAARTLLQGAILGGVTAPDALLNRLTSWATETRSFTFAELLASDLTEPVAAPADSDLQGWYDTHTDAYMRPETRRITYIWLKPENLLDQVATDEAALKAAYEERRAEFVIPERRLVSRLVFPTLQEAEAAKARLDADEASFADLTAERGLAPEDTDLGEVSRDDLGAAADAVFAMTEPGVTGPFDSDLGPALFAMNGVLQAEETTFDEARDDLQAELSLDRARRMVADKQGEIEDALASGATLADVAKDFGMDLGQIDYNSDSEGGLVGYEAFRKTADALTAESFPTLEALDDGGVFALQLDGIDPAAPRPLDEVRDKVAADWTADKTRAALSDLAGADLAQLQNGATLEGLGLVTTHYDDFARDGFVADAPADIGKQVFAMTAGDSRVIQAEGRVFLVTLGAVTPADMANPDVATRRAQIGVSANQEPAGLCMRLAADLDTPVSLMLKLAEAAKMSFMLESVTGGEVRGRYSVVGMKPDLIWECRGTASRINRKARFRRCRLRPPLDGPALDTLRALIAESRIDMPEGVPAGRRGFSAIWAMT